MGLRILITNIALSPPSGTVLVVRDLALELQRQGHTPVVFSSTVGEVAEELRGAGIQVTDSLRSIRTAPDVIHGHHRAPALVAARRWPAVPAIYVCHDHSSPYDRTPIHPSIRRYFGVSRSCVERLIAEGIPVDRARLMLNFVDLSRFLPRAPLPERPRRALVFSNYATAEGYLPVIREACRAAGLELDVVGAGVGRIVTTPEQVLGRYDVVFAKGKAAIEAMAVGAAVILCDYGRVGPMVTSAALEGLRPLNFGFEAIREPLGLEALLREIARYDADDAARVRDRIRADAGLVDAVERLLAIYGEAMAEAPVLLAGRTMGWSLRERLFLRFYRSWQSSSPADRTRLNRLPGVGLAKRGVRRLLRNTGL